MPPSKKKRQLDRQERDAPPYKRQKRTTTKHIEEPEEFIENEDNLAHQLHPDVRQEITKHVTDKMIIRDKEFAKICRKKKLAYKRLTRDSAVIVAACAEEHEAFAKAKFRGAINIVNDFAAKSLKQQIRDAKRYITGKARVFCKPLILDEWVPHLESKFGGFNAEFMAFWKILRAASWGSNNTSLFKHAWFEKGRKLPFSVDDGPVAREEYDALVRELEVSKAEAATAKEEMCKAQKEVQVLTQMLAEQRVAEKMRWSQRQQNFSMGNLGAIPYGIGGVPYGNVSCEGAGSSYESSWAATEEQTVSESRTPSQTPIDWTSGPSPGDLSPFFVSGSGLEAFAK